MPTSAKILEVLYVSTIADDAPISVVADIAAKARVWNLAHDLTGILIFDGLRFCQQIEGPQKEVLALIERITLDARHSNITIFHHGPLNQRRFNDFSLAFTNVEDTEVVAQLEKLDGAAGVAAFIALLAQLDQEVKSHAANKEIQPR